MRHTRNSQFRFPAIATATAPVRLRVQHARAISPVPFMSFDFNTVNNNDPFDFSTLATNVLTTPAWTPTATFPDFLTTTKAVAEPYPTAKNYTDLTEINTKNSSIDEHKKWVVAACLVATIFFVIFIVIITRLTSTKRWRHKKSTAPIERIKMVVPNHMYPRESCSMGLHGSLNRPNDMGAWTGRDSRRPLEGYAQRSYDALPAYPGRTYGYGHTGGINGERRYFGGI